MPRMPEKQKSISAPSPEHQPTPDDIIHLDLARAEKQRRDQFRKIQLEDRALRLRDSLEIEIDALHKKSQDSGGDDLTRKSLELINKQLAHQTSRMDNHEQDIFSAVFETHIPELMRNAAIFENEARENFIENRILQQINATLETDTIKPNSSTHQSIQDLIRDADIQNEKKQKFTQEVDLQIILADAKNKITKNRSLRDKVSEGKISLIKDELGQAEIKRYARHLIKTDFENQTKKTIETFKDLEQQLIDEEVSYSEIKDLAKDLPAHLRGRLRETDKKFQRISRQARLFGENPNNKKAGQSYLSTLIEDVDIISNADMHDFVTSFVIKHQIVPTEALGKLRFAVETTDPVRLEATIDMAIAFEEAIPDIFKDKEFSSLKERMSLIRFLRKLHPDVKKRHIALKNITSPDKPVTRGKMEEMHSDWLSSQTELRPDKNSDEESYRHILLSALVTTQGERELALELTRWRIF